MKTKLDLAHDYAMQAIDTGYVCETDKLVFEAWRYADAMYEQLEKRDKEAHSKLTDGLDAAINEAANDILELKQWQPDRSQSPAGFDWFAIGGIGAFWYRKMPTWNGTEWSDYKDSRPGSETECALWFDYEGRLQESLRKRP